MKGKEKGIGGKDERKGGGENEKVLARTGESKIKNINLL